MSADAINDAKNSDICQDATVDGQKNSENFQVEKQTEQDNTRSSDQSLSSNENEIEIDDNGSTVGQSTSDIHASVDKDEKTDVGDLSRQTRPDETSSEATNVGNNNTALLQNTQTTTITEQNQPNLVEKADIVNTSGDNASSSENTVLEGEVGAHDHPSSVERDNDPHSDATKMDYQSAKDSSSNISDENLISQPDASPPITSIRNYLQKFVSIFCFFL